MSRSSKSPNPSRRREGGTRRPHSSSSSSLLTLRIAGLGHHIELDMPTTATLATLKSEIESRTNLPAPYQRLVAKHKKLDDDTLVLGPTIFFPDSNNNGAIKEMGIGLEDRTKLLLLHSPLYATDKEGVETLKGIHAEIDKVDAGRRSREMDNKTVHELITQLCCKCDEVETNGSEALRMMRKETIRRAEGVAKKSDESKRGIDP